MCLGGHTRRGPRRRGAGRRDPSAGPSKTFDVVDGEENRSASCSTTRRAVLRAFGSPPRLRVESAARRCRCAHARVRGCGHHHIITRAMMRSHRQLQSLGSSLVLLLAAALGCASAPAMPAPSPPNAGDEHDSRRPRARRARAAGHPAVGERRARRARRHAGRHADPDTVPATRRHGERHRRRHLPGGRLSAPVDAEGGERRRQLARRRRRHDVRRALPARSGLSSSDDARRRAARDPHRARPRRGVERRSAAVGRDRLLGGRAPRLDDRHALRRGQPGERRPDRACECAPRLHAAHLSGDHDARLDHPCEARGAT